MPKHYIWGWHVLVPFSGPQKTLLDLSFPAPGRGQGWWESEWLSGHPQGCSPGMTVRSFASRFICYSLAEEIELNLFNSTQPTMYVSISSVLYLLYCWSWRCVQKYHFSEVAGFTLRPLEYFPPSSNSSNVSCYACHFQRIICTYIFCHSDPLVRQRSWNVLATEPLPKAKHKGKNCAWPLIPAFGAGALQTHPLWNSFSLSLKIS